MLPAKIIMDNRKTFLAYNEFRKDIFSRLAPRESEVILYLLPWLLSINHPAFPGYVKNLAHPVQVKNINNEKKIIQSQPAFHHRFSFRGEASLLKPFSSVRWIQGLYTIGSAGSIGQTSKSDCDIWICIRRDDFNNGLREQLQEKARLIKDWLDTQIRMPVFFFLCNVEDIREGNFGQVELESSGSAQKNVLKEEFYRTLILICGKIPLWWVCWSPEGHISYEETASGFAREGESDDDFLDLGNIETVAPQEYFGAALWQFNKSLTQPLKSIIKMILLRMVVTSPAEELLCHSFRKHILAGGKQPFIDPAFFVTRLAFDYLRGKDEKAFAFVRKCFYLSYDMKLLTKNVTYRETLAQDLFSGQGLEEREILHLNAFSDWNYQEQILFGTELFSLLRMIYSEINALQGALAGELTPRDVTVLGRKLASCLAQKPHKVPVLRKPIKSDNPPSITFKYANQGVWHTYPAEEESSPLMAHRDILYCLAYLVWNDALSTDQVHMIPNITAVTMQEIINTARQIKNCFGCFDIAGIDFDNFLDPEKILRVLAIIHYPDMPGLKSTYNYSALYLNNWGELFHQRFTSEYLFQDFLHSHKSLLALAEVNYYLQRGALDYEKTINRIKGIVARILAD